MSNRALLIAGLAEGESSLSGLLDSDDTRVMARAIQQLGATLEGELSERVSLRGIAGRASVPSEAIDVHASGTAARFLTAALALVPGEALLDGNARMRQRPIFDLVNALATLGVEIVVEGQHGCPPVRARGGRAFGGEVEVDAGRSSQYISALLQIAPYAARDVTLHLKDGVLVSKPYVDVTLAIMRTFGAEAGFVDERSLRVKHGATYRGRSYTIEPDASTAAYFFAAAAISGGRVRVDNLPGASAQADMRMLDVIEKMGCTIERAATSVTVRGPKQLAGVDVDMNDMPDAVLALAVTAAFAKGPTRIRNVANLRIKET
ncbi:MAG TPA: 3-phosphoshikimate 1-carboxyvinyltransferase, partial [Polyangiales bacterium]